MTTRSDKLKRYGLLLLLIIAGSAIYELAYIRYNYYDIMMEALRLNNTQMGMLMSVYGIGATICYFPGGWLADRVSCKKLLMFSLLSTGIVGFWFATFPSYTICLVIHLIWSVTNTLTFWAAMIKATRMLGDSSEQGKMFGILEGGRGLIPMIYGMVILGIFNWLGAQIAGFRAVVIGYSLICITAGLLIGVFFKEIPVPDEEKQGSLRENIVEVVKMPAVWLVALIIFSSYSVYIGQGYLTPYLTEFFHISVSLSALIGLVRTYFIAVFAGPLGGIFADKAGSSIKVLFYSFIVIIAALGAFLLLPASPGFLWPVVIAMVLLAFAVFVTRGIYFASIDEVNIPLRYTGTAVGFASFIGFIPEGFLYTLIGSWLDNYGGVSGYRTMFLFMTAAGVAGAAICFLLLAMIKKRRIKNSVIVKK